jgi:hypothetical protein
MAELSLVEQFKSMVAANIDPVLSDDEIDTLLAKFAYRTIHPTWAASTAYAVGETVIPSPRNGHYYVVTVAGTSGGTQPNFPTNHLDTVVDGTVTWQEVDDTPSYNLNRAAAEGWRWKAGKVANRYTMWDATQRLNRSDLHKHCLLQAKMYASKSVSAVQVTGGYTGYNDPVIGNLNAG